MCRMMSKADIWFQFSSWKKYSALILFVNWQLSRWNGPGLWNWRSNVNSRCVDTYNLKSQCQQHWVRCAGTYKLKIQLECIEWVVPVPTIFRSAANGCHVGFVSQAQHLKADCHQYYIVRVVCLCSSLRRWCWPIKFFIYNTFHNVFDKCKCSSNIYKNT